MKIFKLFFALPLLLFYSCNDTPQKVVAADSTITIPTQIIDTIFNNGFVLIDPNPAPTKHLPIGNTGLFIDLPVTHRIEQQKVHPEDNFSVYYFTPIDTSVYHGEAGMYFGPKPEMRPPNTSYTTKTIAGTFLGVKTNWTEYTTQEYMQTETFIENGGDQKIHIWFYANNPEEMARLLKMVRTITR
jgi:hypothetical protein